MMFSSVSASRISRTLRFLSIGSPVLLRPVSGSPTLRGGALLPRLLLALRHLGARALWAIPCSVTKEHFESDLGSPLMSLDGITSHRPPAGAYYGRNLIRGCRLASVYRRATDGR